MAKCIYHVGGSGLGLFISRRLTELHGGAIGFASEAGVGSTFAFYIKSRLGAPPTPRPASPGAHGDDASPHAPQAPKAPKTPEAPDEARGPPADKHILLVEDNIVNQRVLGKQLRRLGMQVTVANHGGECLAYLRSTRYCSSEASAPPLSLVLMDWEMPVMNGLTCVRSIRQLQKEGTVKGHVPIIGITANVRLEQLQEAMEAGMDDVMSKPFRIPELCACIDKTLSSTGQS